LYDGLWTRYIGKTLGGLRFGELTPTAVRVWHSSLVAAARPGPVTVAKAYRLLNTVTNDAVRDGLLLRSPCTIRGAGSERSPEMRTITVDEVIALSKAMPSHLSAMVMVAAFGGLRWGELTGLARGAVDISAGTLRVHQALIETTSGKMSFGPPKTEAGRRTVHLPSVVMIGIADHLRARSIVDESALVFSTLTGCPLRRSGFVQIWRTATTSAAVEGLRFHDLRHTAATLATVHGATVREVQARLGHSTAQAALRYQHATRDRDQLVAQRLDQLLVIE
jgi:integrase